MSKYTLEMAFGTEASREEVLGWVDALLTQAPEGASITIHQEPLALEATELTEAHYGHTVEFVTRDHRTVIGELQQVIQAGGNSRESVVLVVDGEAWPLNYGVVAITDW